MLGESYNSRCRMELLISLSFTHTAYPIPIAPSWLLGQPALLDLSLAASTALDPAYSSSSESMMR